MIKRLSLLLLCTLFAGIMMAQEQANLPARLQRTPEEEAQKQTERLARELNIRDSVRIDTLYRMHLKYAVLRRTGLSRAQEMERMNAIVAELKRLLTPDEYDRFMNHPAEQPRRPHGAKMMAKPDVVIIQKPSQPTQSR